MASNGTRSPAESVVEELFQWLAARIWTRYFFPAVSPWRVKARSSEESLFSHTQPPLNTGLFSVQPAPVYDEGETVAWSEPGKPAENETPLTV